MKTYTLDKSQYLPITINEAWNFFSSAKNLSKITPPEMKFIIRTALKEGPIFSGMKIEYTVRPLLNIPLHWITGIMNVDAPRNFTDCQLKGPYALWQHTHTFETVVGGVKMTDHVEYALPLGFLGGIAHVLVVKKKLKEIFDFRSETLVNLFGNYKK